MATKKRACKSCKASLADAPPGEVRCERCQANFEQWLRGDSPTTYTPRRDGVWADIHKNHED